MKNTLIIYDFDDTLVSTTSAVYVKNKNSSSVKELVAHKFYEYELGPDEEFDMSEFEKLNDPELLPLFDDFVNDIKNYGKNSVAILTARYNTVPIKKFLNELGIVGIEIVGVGIKNPSPGDKDVAAGRKKQWIKSQIIKRNLNIVIYFDDNEDNIISAKSLEDEFKNVKFLITLV